MATSDITTSIIIFIVFGMMFFFNILSVGIKKIKKNWKLYRCNPLVMPFASVFGQDTTTNFTYCIQNMQTDYMGHLLRPLNFNLGVITSLQSSFAGSLNFIRYFTVNLRKSIGGITGSFFGIFYNVIIEFQKIILGIRDLIAKLVGILVIQMYSVQGASLTGQSWWNGPPGEMLRTLCFHPDTEVELSSGEKIPMKDIPLNAKLKGGSKVNAVMNISNLDDSNNYKEQFYEIGDSHPILVTGNHLIYDIDTNNFIFVKNHPEAKLSKMKPTPTLSCLITSNHIITIGNKIFHDWEDNQL